MRLLLPILAAYVADSHGFRPSGRFSINLRLIWSNIQPSIGSGGATLSPTEDGSGTRNGATALSRSARLLWRAKTATLRRLELLHAPILADTPNYLETCEIRARKRVQALLTVSANQSHWLRARGSSSCSPGATALRSRCLRSRVSSTCDSDDVILARRRPRRPPARLSLQ